MIIRTSKVGTCAQRQIPPLSQPKLLKGRYALPTPNDNGRGNTAELPEIEAHLPFTALLWA